MHMTKNTFSDSLEGHEMKRIPPIRAISLSSVAFSSLACCLRSVQSRKNRAPGLMMVYPCHLQPWH